MTTAEYLARLEALHSPAILAYCAKLRAFLAADASGVYHPAEAWGKARDDKEEAWDALRPGEKELVRACGREEGR